MKNTLIIILLITLLKFMSSCKDKREPDFWNLPPNDFYYLITHNGNRLSDSTLEDLKFYYFNSNGQKVYRDPNTDNEAANHVLKPSWIGGNEHLDEAGVRLCMEINSFGVIHNTWYFEYSNGNIDTLYVESIELNKEQGRNDDCYCITPFSIVRFNGIDAYKHSTLKAADGKPVWVLEK